MHPRPKHLRGPVISIMDNTQLGRTASASGSKSLSEGRLAGIGAWATLLTPATYPTRVIINDEVTAVSRPYTSLLRYNGLNCDYLMKFNDRANMNSEFDGGSLNP